jgi:hypothetical protein
MGNRRSAYRVLVGRPQGMNPFGTPRFRRENNIFQEGGMDWIDMVQNTDRWRTLVKAAMDFGLS